MGENAYNGKIEKLKGKNYTICYWDLDQTYEDDGEDYKVLLHELVVDFICGDRHNFFQWPSVLHIFLCV